MMPTPSCCLWGPFPMHHGNVPIFGHFPLRTNHFYLVFVGMIQVELICEWIVRLVTAGHNHVWLGAGLELHSECNLILGRKLTCGAGVGFVQSDQIRVHFACRCSCLMVFACTIHFRAQCNQRALVKLTCGCFVECMLLSNYKPYHCT